MKTPNDPILPVFLSGLIILLSAFSVSMEVPKSTIHLVPDPGFGTGIDWGYYFPTGADQLIGFLRDGSFYIASYRRNKVLFVGPAGELLSEFGQPGQGPGDLTYPDDVSILDNRYVVVKESGMTRRISIFDLQGRIYKLIQADAPLLSCIALGNGKIALVTGQFYQNSRKDSIFIKDIHSNQTIAINSFSYEIPERSRIQVPNTVPKVHLARIDRDKLLVGFSGNLNLSMYSTEGNKLETLSLDIPLRKISKGDMEAYLIEQAEAERDENRKSRLMKTIRESLGTMSFPEFLPAYHELAVDSKDRILVYDHGAWLSGSSVTYRVYSKTGKLISETQIENNDFKPVLLKNFYDDWIYVFLRNKVDDGTVVFTRVSIH